MRGHKQQRGPNTWRLFVRAPDPTTGRSKLRSRTYHGTARNADRALADFVREALKGELGTADTVTIEQLLNKWYDHRASAVAYNTLRGYRSKIDLHIVPLIGDRKITTIDAYQLDDLYRRLRNTGLSSTSVHHVHGILHAAFAQAVRWHWLRDNPAADATVPGRERFEPKELSPDIVAKAINTAPSTLGLAARLAAVTGRREGELCGLRWSDFDPHRRSLRIWRRAINKTGGAVEIIPGTKNNTVTTLGIDRRTVALLRHAHWCARARARACGLTLSSDAHILSEQPDGRPLSPKVISHRWSRHRDRLGLKIRFHDLRHWNASIALDAGAQRARVAQRIGHSKGRMTDHYTHVMRASDHDLADIAARALD